MLEVLNKTEELSKINIFIRLFKAKIEEEIDDKIYRRMMLQVNHTMYVDLLFLKDHICNDRIQITSNEEESLLVAGWLSFVGIGWGAFTERGKNLYRYTKTAKQFCNIVFHNNIEILEW